jgi:hypothetical protein
MAWRCWCRRRCELGPDVAERIRPFAEIRNTQTFHSPHAPRLRDEPAYVYDFDPEDDERLTGDYERAEDKVSIIDSERVELRDRMKGWLRFQGREQWEDFKFSTPRERWKVDLRALQGAFVTSCASGENFGTGRFLAARFRMSEHVIGHPGVPDETPEAKKRRGAYVVSVRLQRALTMLATGEAKTQKDACEAAGMTPRALSLALKRPSVREYMRTEILASLGVSASRAAHRCTSSSTRATTRWRPITRASSRWRSGRTYRRRTSTGRSTSGLTYRSAT